MLTSRAFERTPPFGCTPRGRASSRITNQKRRRIMSEHTRGQWSGPVSRRTFLAATGAAAAGFPAVLKAQAREIKVGYLLPVTGPLAFEAALALNGLTLAVDEINAG